MERHFIDLGSLKYCGDGPTYSPAGRVGIVHEAPPSVLRAMRLLVLPAGAPTAINVPVVVFSASEVQFAPA